MSDSEWTPTTVAELSRLIGENARADRCPIVPVGGRTALGIGGRIVTEPQYLSTIELNQVLDYPARDMTVTVESGIRMDRLQEVLREQNQTLPIETAHSSRATLGGAVASNACGPSRFGNGTFRDYVIGISAVDGRGRLFSAGGRVVKNVAGYDLGKLLVGSLGTLAVITSVTLKLRPLPEQKRFVIAAVSPGTIEPVLAQLNKSATRPVVLDVLNAKCAWQIQREFPRELPEGVSLVWLGYEGAESEINWQIETVRNELNNFSPIEVIVPEEDEVEKMWTALVEFQTTSDDPATFQAQLLPSRCEMFLDLCTKHNVAAQVHAGDGVVIGHLSDEHSSLDAAKNVVTALRRFAEDSSGALTILSCDPDWKQELSVFGRLPASWKLMEEIKKKLDPDSVFSPGRLFDHETNHAQKN
ncbi:putative FAD-linked oxidoreductase [Thalassoglobus neptunius]|uniref:Putative FAD-linked oxidoreductase n=1 Tax=Thalassoglobus neptunius TaxID=1938619 RepID=A0A5C5X303_9PLAN|nr:FAD-binding oxidoreductase [Thalassoglobus neptunius]TWT56989.1 putative FAD-linked oxidoreductase [Thalassoglobus neptunius]